MSENPSSRADNPAEPVRSLGMYRHLLGPDTPAGETCVDARCGCHAFVENLRKEKERLDAGDRVPGPESYPIFRPLEPVPAVDDPGWPTLQFRPGEPVKVRDLVEPDLFWKFDQAVTDAFDDMLRRSIPQYEIMRDLVFEIGSRFLSSPATDGTSVLDLGCSRGEGLDRFVRRFAKTHRFLGVDASEPMIEAASRRFEGYSRAGIVEIRRMDLRSEFPGVRGASLVLLVLTLQFVPIERRQRLLEECYSALRPGGALLLVEKLCPDTATTERIFGELYDEMKRRAGYTDDQIARKKLSLEGVLVPLKETENVERLRVAGFDDVSSFWRWANFAGYLAIRY